MTTVTIPGDPAVNTFDMEHIALRPRSDLADAREMVEWWVDSPESGVISRSAVIDKLLDLRALSRSSQMLLWETDHVMMDVPGVNLVDADWWNSTARRLHDLISRIDAAGASTE